MASWHPTRDYPTIDRSNLREISEARALSFWKDAEEFDRIAQEMEAMGEETYPDDDVTHVLIPANLSARRK